MMSPTTDTIRLFLHVLSASVWVGGQVALAGIVPALRRKHPQATKTVAAAFSRVAWTSLGIAILTGIWNLIAVDVADAQWRYTLTAFVHVFFSFAAGGSAAVHTFGKSKLALALGGALGLLFSLGALFLGILLRAGN